MNRSKGFTIVLALTLGTITSFLVSSSAQAHPKMRRQEGSRNLLKPKTPDISQAPGAVKHLSSIGASNKRIKITPPQPRTK